MKETLVGALTRAVESGWVPDALVRSGIRYNVAARNREIEVLNSIAATRSFICEMDVAPIALIPEVANHQHYELPASFFDFVLGPRRKYSCCLWDERTTSLADAEALALQQVVQRAGVEDGMTVLDLGCGWGSLTLYLAEVFPNARVVGVSNSTSQAEFIRAEAATRDLSGVQIRTADMNQFDPGERFDRILSIEMFEHMRNWRRLVSRVTDWLNPEGQFFLHVFTHLTTPYPYVVRGEGDWMSRFFFSGGMMPSHDLAMLIAPPDLELQNRWRIDGTHTPSPPTPG